MSKFQTLLRREWMQHHRGWLVLMLAPPLLVLLLMPFATLQIDTIHEPLTLMAGATGLVALAVLGIAAAAVFIQAPGLARRDRQDRSIEFWLSLPVRGSASIGATLAMHALLMPLLALFIGWSIGQLIGLMVVFKMGGGSALWALPLGTFAAGSLALLLHFTLGVLLAAVWLSPLLLLLMAASAWLKRWGLPALTVVFGGGHLLLANLYGIEWIGATFQALVHNAGRAFVQDEKPNFSTESELAAWFIDLPKWLAHDAWDSVAALFQPLLLLALAVSAACFALLVWRRRRGA